MVRENGGRRRAVIGAQYGEQPRCPLCAGLGAEPFHQDPKRSFWRCPVCALVFVSPAQRPDMETERAPAVFLARVANLVRPGGVFAVMTSFYEDAESFAPWWYKRDITHVCFYHEMTMQWVARTNRWALDLPATNVALFTL